MAFLAETAVSAAIPGRVVHAVVGAILESDVSQNKQSWIRQCLDESPSHDRLPNRISVHRNMRRILAIVYRGLSVGSLGIHVWPQIPEAGK